MLRVGLTGGIGSGKSEVSRLFVAHGAALVDADVNARVVVAKGTPGLQQVVEAFGAGILDPDGELDRPALGAIVFADPDKLATLNAIVHPLVAEESARQTAEAEVSGALVLIHDVPLLVENGLQSRYDAVVVVAASPAPQVQRLMENRGMTEQDARARIAAQAPLADKVAVASYVIDNDGPLEALAPQVDRVWAALLATAKGSGR